MDGALVHSNVGRFQFFLCQNRPVSVFTLRYENLINSLVFFGLVRIEKGVKILKISKFTQLFIKVGLAYTYGHFLHPIFTTQLLKFSLIKIKFNNKFLIYLNYFTMREEKQQHENSKKQKHQRKKNHNTTQEEQQKQHNSSSGTWILRIGCKFYERTCPILHIYIYIYI